MASNDPASPPESEPKPTHPLPFLEPGRGFGFLEGVTVIDVTTSIAGPYATMLLADMGADVIKIERPGAGDDARGWGPPFLNGHSLWFLSVNRNKRSITLDITKPRGHALLLDLVARSDMVVTNHLPRVQTKLRTDYETLRAVRSDLIYLALTGFGLEGGRKDAPCYDLIAEGYSGIMDLTGEYDGDPQKIGTPAADMLAGMDLAMAAISALYGRMRTGEGACVDVSMVESMTRFLAPRLLSYLGSGELPRRSGARDSVIAIYQVFHAADAPLTLGLGSDAIWARFWEAVGEPETGQDPRFSSNADRRAVRGELVSRIARILQTRPRAHWLEVFERYKVPAGPINRLDEVTQDSELLARSLFYKMPDGQGGTIPQVNTGLHVDGKANQPRRVPPDLGQDTDAILSSVLGLSDADIAELRGDGII